MEERAKGAEVARVRKFFQASADSKAHPTEVDCGWSVVNAPGERLLQLSTYGSAQRQSQPKVSQTIQLDQEAAEDLVRLITKAFPGLKA